jgi:hypothetical protein
MKKPPFQAEAKVVAMLRDGSILKFDAALSIQPRAEDEEDDDLPTWRREDRWRFRVPRAWLDVRGESIASAPILFTPRGSFGKVKAGSVTIAEI